MTRYKVAPGPVGEDRLYAARDALPLVPGSVEDCCTRLRDRTDLPSRDDAREWLTFLQALGLAAETDRGFYRVRGNPDREALADALLTNVFAVREIRDTLAAAERPLRTRAVFREIRETVPQWERNREPAWESVWQGRVERLLEWGVVFGLVDSREDGYAVR